ncbi:uncharacterized protein LOC119107103 [Pollicipes pollicipes]|uniref:uncharacterized protein LOC119107103 n=1 Tax=Pollicipes pollicipes TaxID=41117 RepID=UPI001885221F|nr:uncharacterized protein LOC119107103 [Pollicipes pollicipes]
MAADRANKALPKLKERAGARENAKAITRKMLKAGGRGQRRERAGQKRDVVQDWEQPATADKKKNSRREKKKAVKSRQKERPDDVKFTSLVDKYRQKLAAAPAAGARWFQ